MLANIIKSASFGTRTNTRLMNELRSRSEILEDISKSFVDRSKNLMILSFYETDKMDYLNCKVRIEYIYTNLYTLITGPKLLNRSFQNNQRF